jgi:hypothetical protein
MLVSSALGAPEARPVVLLDPDGVPVPVGGGLFGFAHVLLSGSQICEPQQSKSSPQSAPPVPHFGAQVFVSSQNWLQHCPLVVQPAPSFRHSLATVLVPLPLE